MVDQAFSDALELVESNHYGVPRIQPRLLRYSKALALSLTRGPNHQTSMIAVFKRYFLIPRRTWKIDQRLHQRTDRGSTLYAFDPEQKSAG